MANEVNIYTPRYLAEVVRQAPPVHTFFRDTFFTNVKKSTTERVDIDLVKGDRRMAAFVHPRVGGKVLKASGYKTESYKPPLINPYDVTTADQLMTRLPGEDLYSGMTPAQRAAQKLMEEYATLNDATTRREEWMAVQAIVTGTIPIVGEGVNETIDFGLTNKKTLTGDNKWGGTKADILGNLGDWTDAVLHGGFANVDTIIMGKTAKAKFFADANVQKMLDNRRMNLGEIAEILNSTKSGEVTYSVVKGDTWGQIANNTGMTAAELEALNPGYDINRIHIGDALTLSNAVPYLTVKVTERQNYVEDVNYDVNYVSDSSMYQGDERVISKGSFGKADIVADVTYINGEEQERTVISSVTLSDPVAETRARGTKVRPTWYPTGSFRWPCSGRITSRFGYRRSGYHKGLDIANSYGTPIHAADNGIVITAGWEGLFGKLVKIDQQNGFITYYGHNSSLVASLGQKVHKGQLIARMGSTGRSTGNHCHFEVRYNGVAKNPLNYLP